MKIFNQPIAGIQKVYNQQKKYEHVEHGKNDAKKDGFELSSEARLYNIAMKELSELSEPGTEKLNGLRTALNTGTYQVEQNKLVEKIIEESIF